MVEVAAGAVGGTVEITLLSFEDSAWEVEESGRGMFLRCVIGLS